MEVGLTIRSGQKVQGSATHKLMDAHRVCKAGFQTQAVGERRHFSVTARTNLDYYPSKLATILLNA